MNAAKKKRTALQRLRRFFITTVIGGVAVMLPIALLVVVFRFIWNFLSRVLSPISELLPLHEVSATWLIDLISLSIIVVAFFFVGLFVRTRFGKNVVRNIEASWLEPLPLYGTIRDTVQQFFGNKSMPFSQVVLVNVFNTETLMTGFVTEEHDNDLFTVFVPTGPNPTNGFIFHVKRGQLTFVDTKPEDAMRTIIGVGTGSEILFNGKNVGTDVSQT